jgi:hypothetical protein
MTTQDKKPLPHEGTVAKISQRDGVPTGLMFAEEPEVWYNYTKPEWRDQWFEPSKGDRIRAWIADGRWVKGIERLNGGAPTVFENGQVPAAGRDLSITRQVCLKAAAEIVARQPLGQEFSTSTIAIDVLALAQDFERWVLREEVPFA